MSDESLFEFPCQFPLKVMGREVPDFHSTVTTIVERHAESTSVSMRPSRDGRYVALSITIQATSREQLDALYCELSASDHVLYVL